MNNISGRTFIFRSWPEEKTALLKQMWWDGATAKDICTAVGASTPRAVREKAFREGFARNPDLRSVEPPFEIAGILLPELRADGTLVNVENVHGRECRYIYGDEPFVDAPMCGRATELGRSWCSGHRKILYQKASVPC